LLPVRRGVQPTQGTAPSRAAEREVVPAVA
jgi:hypothetical protein